MIIFILFILFWYFYCSYNFLKRETKKILHGRDAFDYDDLYTSFRVPNYESNYNKNDKLAKKVFRILLNYILVLIPLVALIIFLYDSYIR